MKAGAGSKLYLCANQILKLYSLKPQRPIVDLDPLTEDLREQAVFDTLY
jgi:hypothetical protein